jgi:hypothetical protein
MNKRETVPTAEEHFAALAAFKAWNGHAASNASDKDFAWAAGYAACLVDARLASAKPGDA